MNNEIIDFADFDPLSALKLSRMNFIDFNKIQKNNVLASIRGRYQGQTIRGMTNVAPLVNKKMTRLDSDEIFNRYFPVADNLYYKGISTVNDVQTSCIDPKDFDIFKESFFIDENANRTRDTNEYGFDLIVYTSKNGLKIKEAYECITPKQNEAILFIEDNTDDFSNQVLYGKVSEEFRKGIKEFKFSDQGQVFQFINKKVPVSSAAIINELFEKGFIEAKKTPKDVIIEGLYWYLTATFSPMKALGWLATKIGESIDFLLISENIWDTQAQGYWYKKETIIKGLTIDVSLFDNLQQVLVEKQKGFKIIADVIPNFLEEKIKKTLAFLKKLVDSYNSFIEIAINNADFSFITEHVAFYSGLWNGLVDFISGIFKFVGMLCNTPSSIVTNFQTILEFFDTLHEEGIDFSFTEFAQGIYEKIKNYLKENGSDDYDWTRIAYCTGFGFTFIATFFIPYANITKLVNFEKQGAQISQLIAKFVEEVSAGAEKVATIVGSKTQQAYDASLRLLSKFIDLLGNAQKLQAFLESVWEKLAQWFLKNKKLVMSAYDKALLEGWEVLAKYFKTEKIIKATNGAEILCVSFRKALVPIDKILMYARGKVRGVENLTNLEKEFAELKNLKQTTRKVFDQSSENAKRLEKLKKDIDNIKKSIENRKALENVGILDDIAGNRKLFDFVLAFMNRNSNKIESGTKYFFNISGTRGKTTGFMTFKKLQNGKLYLTTIHIF